LDRLHLNNAQKRYAGQAYRQIKDNGVALIQLPTGQGKTIIALKILAEILSHSKKPKPIVLVTRKMEDKSLLNKAFRGEALSKIEYENHPWIRDAFLANQ
jgi:Rad3-related DNA helicase